MCLTTFVLTRSHVETFSFPGCTRPLLLQHCDISQGIHRATALTDNLELSTNRQASSPLMLKGRGFIVISSPIITFMTDLVAIRTQNTKSVEKQLPSNLGLQWECIQGSESQGQIMSCVFTCLR